MKIWHVGAAPKPNTVNGVNSTIWLLAAAQAQLGCEVAVLCDGEPDQTALDAGRQGGFRVVRLAAINSMNEAASGLPDLVHMHSVFVPQQALLARHLHATRIPYVVSPHGGLAPAVLRRSRWRKAIYTWLIERQRLHNSAGIILVAPGEAGEISDFLPGYTGPIECIWNPVEITGATHQRWEWHSGRPQLLFMGRFDVFHKGIDRAIALARILPDVDMHFYGLEDARARAEFKHLKSTLPSTAHFHPPVYGTQKIAALLSATLYIQLSRWEAFGISVAEAMALGVPCAVSQEMHIADLFRAEHLGLVLALDVYPISEVVKSLRVALADPTQLRGWSVRSQATAKALFDPIASAARHLDFYCGVLQSIRLNDRVPRA